MESTETLDIVLLGGADQKHRLVLVRCVPNVYTDVHAITARQCQQLESVCCQEIDNSRVLLVGDPLPACITLHTDFNSAFLCTVILLIAYHGDRHHYETSDVPTYENR